MPERDRIGTKVRENYKRSSNENNKNKINKLKIKATQGFPSMLDSGIQGIHPRDGADPTELLLDQLDEEESHKSDKWTQNIDNRDFDTMTNPDIQSMA